MVIASKSEITYKLIFFKHSTPIKDIWYIEQTQDDVDVNYFLQIGFVIKSQTSAVAAHAFL